MLPVVIATGSCISTWWFKGLSYLSIMVESLSPRQGIRSALRSPNTMQADYSLALLALLKAVVHLASFLDYYRFCWSWVLGGEGVGL